MGLASDNGVGHTLPVPRRRRGVVTAVQASGLYGFRGSPAALYSVMYLYYASLCYQLFIHFTKADLYFFLSRFALRVTQLEADGRILTRNEAICLCSPPLP